MDRIAEPLEGLHDTERFIGRSTDRVDRRQSDAELSSGLAGGRDERRVDQEVVLILPCRLRAGRVLANISGRILDFIPPGHGVEGDAVDEFVRVSERDERAPTRQSRLPVQPVDASWSGANVAASGANHKKRPNGRFYGSGAAARVVSVVAREHGAGGMQAAKTVARRGKCSGAAIS